MHRRDRRSVKCSPSLDCSTGNVVGRLKSLPLLSSADSWINSRGGDRDTDTSPQLFEAMSQDLGAVPAFVISTFALRLATEGGRGIHVRSDRPRRSSPEVANGHLRTKSPITRQHKNTRSKKDHTMRLRTYNISFPSVNLVHRERQKANRRASMGRTGLRRVHSCEALESRMLLSMSVISWTLTDTPPLDPADNIDGTFLASAPASAVVSSIAFSSIKENSDGGPGSSFALRSGFRTG